MSLRILIADDNADTLLTLRMLLEEDGHHVRTLDNGGAVVPAVREFEPNVCILDIEMPGASGHAIAAELRGIYRSERPFMIAISGKWYSPSDRPADPRELAYLLDGAGQRM